MILLLAASLLAGGISPASADRPDSRTRVVVLGVAHSIQLVSRRSEPATILALFERIKPAAVCLELTPSRYSAMAWHEFTYEQQQLLIPYARERRLPVYPFDWEPAAEDEFLAFGLTWNPPPLIRRRRDPQFFLSFTDSALQGSTPFFADSAKSREEYRSWYDARDSNAMGERARRLFLYRTSLQAARIAAAAKRHPGEIVLVVVGAFHKDDIEQALGQDSTFEIVQPSTYGLPAPGEVEPFRRPDQFSAIAAFNLLGLQSRVDGADWTWLADAVGRVRDAGSTAEADLLETRLGVLAGRIPPREARDRYRRIGEAAGNSVFRWTGVLDRRRLDSYFDPFGNLTIAQRARLEMARESAKLNEPGETQRLRRLLAGELPELQRVQLEAYWREFLEQTR